MKLEDKFCNSFFYPFLISIVLSTLVVTLFIGLFTDNFYDKRTYNNIISMEKEYSKIYINSAGAILKTSIEKIHSSLNEHILYYQRMANKILELNNTNDLNLSEYLKCAQNIDYLFCYYHKEETFDKALWTLGGKVNEDNLDSYPDVKKQLLAYDRIIPNINASLEATKPDAFYYYFYFEKMSYLYFIL